MTHPFAQAVIESCKKDSSYVVMLKPQHIDEAHKRIENKCTKVGNIGNMVHRYSLGDVKISFYITGKIILKHVPEDVNQFLNELLE